VTHIQVAVSQRNALGLHFALCLSAYLYLCMYIPTHVIVCVCIHTVAV
jgi:hypothetical protein